ncbi:MAG: 50S ribosomal protein L22 [Acidobacteria bacterium]|nr:50S ribosomal protein L22 [Acidobacteriota bacterium]MCB9399625.1 50S ribosomal protein L22 [Acidobacteriota bacterium]
MNAIAKAKFIRGSARKARLVIDQIRGKNVGEAMQILKFSPKRASEAIEICLKSAVSNALQKNTMLDADDLFVSMAVVDGGPVMKRIRPASMGRAFRVRKRFHHITIEVSNSEQE